MQCFKYPELFAVFLLLEAGSQTDLGQGVLGGHLREMLESKTRLPSLPESTFYNHNACQLTSIATISSFSALLSSSYLAVCFRTLPVSVLLDVTPT